MLRSRNKIGELDRVLNIENNTPTKDATTGEPIDAWSAPITVRAKRLLRSGKESFEAEQEVDTNVESYIIRYSSQVSAIDGTYRVYEKGTTDYFYITLVEMERREGYITIKAERKI